MTLLSLTAVAQNTKGDKPVAAGKETRETRFKIHKKHGDRAKTKDVAGRRLRTKNYHSERPQGRVSKSKSGKQQRGQGMDQPYHGHGQPVGKRIRAKESEGARARNYYPPTGPYVSNPSKKPGTNHPDWSREARRIPTRHPSSQPHRTYNPSNYSKGRRIPPSSVHHYTPGNFRTAKGTRYNPAHNIYPQNGPYVHNPSRKPGANKPDWSRQTRRVPVRRPSSQTRRTYNAANFRVARRSGYSSGHNIYPRTGTYVNNPSPRPRQRVQPYSNREKLSRLARISSQPQGPGKHRVAVQSASHSFISRKSTNFYARFPRAKPRSNIFSGKDLTGHPLLKRNYRSPSQVFEGAVSPYANRKRINGDHPFSGNGHGYKSATRTTARPWQGDIAGRRVKGKNFRSTLPGAGVALGRTQPLGVRRLKNFQGSIRYAKSFSPQGEGYGGNIKAHRPPKGAGGSASASWNNSGKAVAGKTFSLQGANFAGNIKTKRPAKGGGSASASWNNGGKSVVGRGPSVNDQRIARYQGSIKRYGNGPSFSEQGENYAGNIKAKKPVKGAGGSISGSWNNNGKAIAGRIPTSYDNKIAAFSGSLKAKKSATGGGSASASWNNEGKAIARNAPSSNGLKAQSYAGTLKAKKPAKGVGGSVSGQLWNNERKPIAVHIPTNSTGQFEGSFRVKRPNPKGNSIEGLQVKVKEGSYQKNKYADARSLKGVAPSHSSTVANNSARGIKQDWQYVHNPNSDDEALKVRNPARAVARAASYEGNVRMHKYPLFAQRNAYPDARFEKSNKDNVDGERGLFNSVMLLWAKIFGKGGSMPSSTKEKQHRPRFDKGEKDLWYD